MVLHRGKSQHFSPSFQSSAQVVAWAHSWERLQSTGWATNGEFSYHRVKQANSLICAFLQSLLILLKAPVVWTVGCCCCFFLKKTHFFLWLLISPVVKLTLWSLFLNKYLKPTPEQPSLLHFAWENEVIQNKLWKQRNYKNLLLQQTTVSTFAQSWASSRDTQLSVPPKLVLVGCCFDLHKSQSVQQTPKLHR